MVPDFYENRGDIIKQFPILPCREFCDRRKTESLFTPSHCIKEWHGSSSLFSNLILNLMHSKEASFLCSSKVNPDLTQINFQFMKRRNSQDQNISICSSYCKFYAAISSHIIYMQENTGICLLVIAWGQELNIHRSFITLANYVICVKRSRVSFC